MKALLKAVLLLCLTSPAFAQAEKEAPKVGCISHLSQTDKALRLKGAILITQMMNDEVYVATYVGTLPAQPGKEPERVAVFVMAVRKEGAPRLPTRIKCVRETDGQEFELLQLIFPLNEQRA